MPEDVDLDKIDVSQLTEEQLWLVKRFSSMVGKVLYIVEGSALDDRQCRAVKKQIQDEMYAARNDCFKSLPKPVGFK